MNPDQVTLSRSGDNLVFTLSNGEAVTIVEQLDNNPWNYIEQVEFDDGTVWTPDNMRNRMVSDMKATGAVVGTKHAETYRHARGDGSYSITDKDYGQNVDRLIFSNVNPDAVTLSRTDDDLVLTLSNGEAVTLVDQLGHRSNFIEQVEFANGTVWTPEDMRHRMVSDMKATGAVVGTAYAETYRHALGDGSYSITDKDYGQNVDRLIFSNVSPDGVTLSHTDDDLVLTLSNGEAVTLVDQLGHRSNFIEQVEFADGTVWTTEDMRNRMVSDMKSTGAVVGTRHAETYRHALGDGSYSITDKDYGRNVDRLIFSNVSPDGVTLSRTDDDLVLTLSNGEAVTLVDQLGHRSNFIEQVEFADGTVWTVEDQRARLLVDLATDGDDLIHGFDGDDAIVGGLGADTLHGGRSDDTLTGAAGDDVLFGGAGADTFVFNADDGADTIEDFEDGIDTIRFEIAGLGVSDLTITDDGDDALITYDGGDTIRLSSTSSEDLSASDFAFA